ncbi:MAG: bifunctional diguanylate cyclase/phosphodiesterase [Acetatifactor sp.]|nr:bifunctional diguanylate cyclase/phosphodiesterase [Acetatifactor sp.]
MNELHYQIDLLKAMNAKLTAKESMYNLICSSLSDAFIYYSFEKDEYTTLGKWSDLFDFEINDSRDFETLFESVEDSYILPLRDTLYAEKRNESSASVDCRIKDSVNKWVNFSVKITYNDDLTPHEKIIIISDITKNKIQNDELSYLAYFDSLTNLYNRNYFVRVLGSFIDKAKAKGDVVSVMVIDIDDFKRINDGLGIVIGDELIQQLGDFIKDFTNDNVIACHLSSDIFAMAMYDPVDERSVDYLEKCISQRTKRSFNLSGGQEIQITVSIGVAEFPEAAESALELINCAEIVMYKSKSMGKNTIQYFNTPLINEFIASVEIENKLREAVFSHSFELFYQPQYSSVNHRLRGAEALIRWKDDKGTSIPPSTFIPIAEKNGNIIPIGKWVIEESIRKYMEWKEAYDYDFVLSINISAMQYKRDEFVADLIDVINKYHMNPAYLELEITESILIDDYHKVMEKLKRLRDYGIRVSLDDFGTGFSSLSYLKKFPIDTVKIDKSFVDTVLNDSATRIITESIINMSKALGFETVAEGVEQEEQYKYLNAIGVDNIQGFLFGKPMPASEFSDILKGLM